MLASSTPGVGVASRASSQSAVERSHEQRYLDLVGTRASRSAFAVAIETILARDDSHPLAHQAQAAHEAEQRFDVEHARWAAHGAAEQSQQQLRAVPQAA